MKYIIIETWYLGGPAQATTKVYDDLMVACQEAGYMQAMADATAPYQWTVFTVVEVDA